MTTEKTPHRWADVLRAIADGEEVQFWHESDQKWVTITITNFNPINNPTYQWRIKPKKQTVWVNVYFEGDLSGGYSSKREANERSAQGRVACVPLTFTEGDGL